MLLSSVAGALVWNKFNSVPMSVRAEANIFEILKYKEPLNFDLPTPKQRAKTRHVVEGMIEELTKEFPNLAAKSHPVPDSENAFLQLHLLSGSDYSGPQLSTEFQEILNSETPLDTDAAKRCLEEHSNFVSQIEEIAILETRSSSNMPDDYCGFISARVPLNGVKVILLRARIAAEAGNENEALRLVTAAARLGAHYREIEHHSLLSETVAVLIDRWVRHHTFEYLLPVLGQGVDLVRWQNLLNQHDYSAATFATVLGGEWFISARYLLYPVILDPSNPNAPKDAKALARTYAANFSSQIESTSKKQLVDLLTYDEKAFSDYEDLSEDSQEIAGMFMIGARAWAKGYVHTGLSVAQYDAAMELLIIERKEGSIGAEAAERVVHNPINGEAFEYDPVSRTLSAPSISKDQETERLILPLCS